MYGPGMEYSTTAFNWGSVTKATNIIGLRLKLPFAWLNNLRVYTGYIATKEQYSTYDAMEEFLYLIGVG